MVDLDELKAQFERWKAADRRRRHRFNVALGTAAVVIVVLFVLVYLLLIAPTLAPVNVASCSASVAFHGNASPQPSASGCRLTAATVQTDGTVQASFVLWFNDSCKNDRGAPGCISAYDLESIATGAPFSNPHPDQPTSNALDTSYPSGNPQVLVAIDCTAPSTGGSYSLHIVVSVKELRQDGGSDPAATAQQNPSTAN